MKFDRSIFLFAGMGLFCITMCGFFYTRLGFADIGDIGVVARMLFFDQFFMEAGVVTFLASGCSALINCGVFVSTVCSLCIAVSLFFKCTHFTLVVSI